MTTTPAPAPALAGQTVVAIGGSAGIGLLTQPGRSARRHRPGRGRAAVALYDRLGFRRAPEFDFDMAAPRGMVWAGR
ncbi:MAG TPA: hypothetical protein VMK84_08145 [Streptosporangiaceae bacterium]|nr:hypothetical protein [Streptosporangiaceae bacterium]